MFRHFGMIFAAAGLAACGGAKQAPVQPEDLTPTASQAAAVVEDPKGDPAIPKALQGKWALSPEDCSARPGVAEGLLTIGPSLLRFYESVAHLGRIEEIGEGRLLASFVFQGEGARWTRGEQFDALDNVLVRREYGGTYAPDPVSYTRCET